LFLDQPKEFAMKGHILIVAMAALAATAIATSAAQAGEPSSTADPGFVPDTGQINPGHAAQPWSAAPALPQQQPAQEDARAALMMPDNGAPSAGQGTTAWPLPLSEQQRQEIYKAVMADNSQPGAGAAMLKPGSSLSFEQSRDVHPLPQALASIDGLRGLKFMKGKDKVLLVRPSIGVVIDEVTM
jgi:hypothetical protein